MRERNRLTYATVVAAFALVNLLIILHRQDSAAAKAQLGCRNPLKAYSAYAIPGRMIGRSASI